MKKIMCLIFILLTSCTSAPASPPPMFVSLPLVPVGSSFTYNRECPHICWLEINPGVTTTEEARTILISSNQIDQTSYIENDAGFRLEWYPDSGQSLPIRVGIVVENGVTQKLYFDFNTTVKIREFIDLFGEPDEISVKQELLIEGVNTQYIVYYTLINAWIFASTMDDSVPDPSDSIDILNLNVAPDDPSLPEWLLEYKDLRQLWLGFGHLDEYLKNRPSPLE